MNVFHSLARLLPVLVLGCNADPPSSTSPDAGVDAGPTLPATEPDAAVPERTPDASTASPPRGAGLSDILLSAGQLEPAFSRDHARYRVDLPLWVEHITLEPVAGDLNAVLIDGAPYEGTPVELPLEVGQNTVEVTDTVEMLEVTVDIYRASTIVEDLYGKARIPNEGMQFGYAVEVSGERLVVAAPGDSTSARGIDGNEEELGAPLSGAVFTFTRGSAGWQREAFIKASNAAEEDRFGTAVALAGDLLVVGAPGEDGGSPGVDGRDNDDLPTSGAAYVFEHVDGEWKQTAYLKAAFPGVGDYFGSAVTTDGNRIVIGAYAETSSRAGVNPTSRDEAAPYSGAAYVFERDGHDWAQVAYLKASNANPGDQFGESVALFEDTIVVGAVGEQSSSTEVDGDQRDNSVFTAGAAYVFTVDDAGRFRQTAYLKPTNTREELRFGSAVGVSGDTIAVGALTEPSSAAGIDGDPTDTALDESGAVYLFTREGDRYVQTTYVKASNPGAGDRFGQRLLLRGDALVVGAHGEASAARGVNAPQNDDSAQASGAAYVFFRDLDGAWSERAYLKASNAETGDNFSFGLGFDGVTLVAGAPFEDNAKGGLSMEPSPNNALQSAGAIYVFR